MDHFIRALERIFEVLAVAQRSLSVRWREHTNRRSVVILLAVGSLLLYGWLAILRPPADFPIGGLVSIPQGKSLTDIGEILREESVIRSSLFFRTLMTLSGRERTAQAGDYIFKEPKDLLSVVYAMSIGAFGLEPLRIRVPEGANVREISRVFGTRLQRFNEENFIGQASPMEGYLFPDTYHFLPNATETIVLETLRQNFDAKVASIAPALTASGKDMRDLVILASILEREAYNSEDRRLISGVLWNRLELNMPLQVDAVFFYSLGKGTFDLTIEDLTRDDPYNTYVRKGLPPTPIGSPSIDSLLAAADPIDNDYLFFLADKRGVTHYCRTYACQLENKELYF